MKPEKPTSVLLADDHAVVRAGIRKALEELSGVEIVAEVGDGPTLLSTLDEHHPDCLLIDVTMPDFDPIRCIRKIRAQYPKMKILVVSAYDDDVYVQGLLRAGVDGYHLKDQPLSDLQLAVQRVLSGERWVSGSLVDKLVRYADASVVGQHLTSRQKELLLLLQQGKDNHSIAQELGLSVKTVENHLTRLYRQINVQSRLEAAAYATRHPELFAMSGGVAACTPPTDDETVQEGIRVLLVDDSVRYRHHLRRMIGRICPQATIYEAEGVEEAVRVAENAVPELILLDVILGDEDGIYCARRIKASFEAAHIVLISAYPDRAFHRLGLEAGAVAFLDKKDLEMQTLRNMIEDVVP